MTTVDRSGSLTALSTLLVQAMDALAQGGPDLAERAVELKDMVTRAPRVAVVGRLKAGKSTLVNALTEHHTAATGTLECTMAVSLYLDGQPARAEVLGLDGRVDRVTLGAGPLTDLPRPLDEVDHIRQYLPNARLRELSLIDTPGTATLTVENEQRTRRALIDGRKDTRRASSWADCVVFLSDSAPRDDERAFLADLGMTPLSTIGVLSRADSFGAGAFGPRDPLEHAREHAQRIAAQLGTSVSTVLPLSGLLAETAGTGQVTGEIARNLAQLADLDRDMLLDVVELDDPGVVVPGFTAAMRDDLLDRLGEYGLVHGRAVARDRGAVGLVEWMTRASGVEELTDLLTGDFAYFAVLQRAVRVLDELDELSASHPNRDHVRWVRSVTLAQPGMHFVALYRSYRNTIAATPDSHLLEPLRRAITAVDPAGVVGLPHGTPADQVRSAHEQALGELQEMAMTPLSAAEDEARERLLGAHQAALQAIR